MTTAHFRYYRWVQRSSTIRFAVSLLRCKLLQASDQSMPCTKTQRTPLRCWRCTFDLNWITAIIDVTPINRFLFFQRFIHFSGAGFSEWPGTKKGHRSNSAYPSV